MKQTWAKDRADRASKAKRQVRTSAATIGIIFSAGASNLLLTQIGNSAPAIAANQPSLSQMPIATRAGLTISSIGVPTGIPATVPLAFTRSQTNATQLFEPVTNQSTEKPAKVLQALRVNRLIRQLKASKITASTAALASKLDDREAAIARQKWSIERLRQKLNRLEADSAAELGFEEWQASAIGTLTQEHTEISLLAFQPQLQIPHAAHGNASGEAMPYVLEAIPEARSISLTQSPTATTLPNISVDRPMVLVPLQAIDYKVKAGDTLTAIARQHGLPLTTLIAANQLADPNRIQIAQRLIVPISPAKEIESQQSMTAALKNNSDAGMGGNISEDDSVVENHPQGIAEIQRQQSAKAEQAQLSDRYVQNLRSDIEKLQQRYRAQSLLSQATPGGQSAAKTGGGRLLQKLRQIASVERQIDQGFNSKQASKTLQIEALKQPQRSVRPTEDESGDSLATAPIGRDTTDSLQSIQQRNVSPALPPLDSADTYLPKPTISKKGFMWPARGKLSSGYGYRWGRMHRGIDIAAPVGTPIFAAAAGVVIKSGWNSGGYGNMVDIQHTDGTITRYAHNKRLLVHKGQAVYQGQQISEMGNTGFSTGPHLHFEIHPLGKKAVNPIAFLPR